MKASQIRDKYKQILEEPQSQNSEDEWEIAYSNMARQRKKRILTQSSPNKINFSQNSYNQQNIISVKQKLAQSIANNKLQLKQIQKLKREALKFDEQREQWQQKMMQCKKQVSLQCQKHREKDRRMGILQQQLNVLSNKLNQVSMDRQLLHKQTEYYKTQLTKCQEDINTKERQLRNFDKEIRLIEKMKKENQYLKNDVQRLSFLIEDSLKFGKISKQLMKGHFLGKPYKEFQYWFSQEIIGQAQYFLKKQQVAQGNKEFLVELIKFIDKFSKKSPESRSKTINSSKTKQNPSLKKPSKILQNSRYKKHSFNPFSLREQITLKSNTNSFWKNHESIQYETLTPHCQMPHISIKSLCWDIVTQFKSIVFQLLLQKQVKRKKIKKIIDTMCNQIMGSFELQDAHQLKQVGNTGDNKLNDFLAIRIERNDHTAPMKFTK